MKRIGMLGGMSWESTAEYYRLMNERVRRSARRPALRPAACSASVDFAEIEELQMARRLGPPRGTCSRRRARPCQAGGAELLVLCTQHHAQGRRSRSSAAVDIPLVHLADVVAGSLLAAGHGVVGLLGTAFTMEQDFYRDRLRGEPRASGPGTRRRDRALVHRVIYDELCLGIVRDESRLDYGHVIERPRRCPVPRPSSSAVPRSTCSSATTIRPSRCSTPLVFTRRGPSSSRSRSGVSYGCTAQDCGQKRPRTQRAEEEGGPFKHQPASRILLIDGHLANGIDGEGGAARTRAHRCHQLDYLGYTLQLVSPPRL